MTAAGPEFVHGRGPLAEALRRRLGASVRADAPGQPIVFVARVDQLSNSTCWPEVEPGAAVLLVGVWRSWVFVGSIWRRGDTCGCPRCLLSRVTGSPIGPDEHGREWRPFGADEATLAGSGPAALHVVATLVMARLDAWRDHPQHDVPGRVLVYNTRTEEIAQYLLVPDSHCPVCGPPMRSTLPAFSDPDTPLLKLSPAALRVRPLDAEALQAYVSPLGLFRNPRIDLQSPFGACTIEIPATKGREPEPAMGRAESYQQSRAIAVLEGLERYCGLHRGGPRRVVRAPYRDVAAQAVHPPSFGLHPAESYASPGWGFRPFTAEVVIDWVEAYSFARRGPVLVPERAAFWGPRDDGEATFFYETSNGCALGASIEEATLHGLRELVERDSFLLTWYLQLRLPEVDLRNDPDPELRAVLRRAELFTGYEFRAFVSTMEHGMPSVWLVAVGGDPQRPAVLAGAGAHPDPRQAVLGGVYELAKLALAIVHYYSDRRQEALAMFHEPNRVRLLEHHPLVNCLPEARGRFAFLLDRQDDPIPLAAVPATTRTDSHDLRADLDTAVQGLLRTGLDVLVVDQTMAEVARAGLACVKVLVPGLLPMTFGHRNRRTTHLPRLADPSRLPYPSDLPAGVEPGQIPHPFH